MSASNVTIDSGLRGGAKPDVSAVSRHTCRIRRASAGCCSLAAAPSGSGVAEPSWRRDVRRARRRRAKCSRRSSHTVRRTRRARRGPSSHPWSHAAMRLAAGVGGAAGGLPGQRRRGVNSAPHADAPLQRRRRENAAGAATRHRRIRCRASWRKWKRSPSSAVRHRGEHQVPQRERRRREGGSRLPLAEGHAGCLSAPSVTSSAGKGPPTPLSRLSTQVAPRTHRPTWRGRGVATARRCHSVRWRTAAASAAAETAPVPPSERAAHCGSEGSVREDATCRCLWYQQQQAAPRVTGANAASLR